MFIAVPSSILDHRLGGAARRHPHRTGPSPSAGRPAPSSRARGHFVCRTQRLLHRRCASPVAPTKTSETSDWGQMDRRVRAAAAPRLRSRPHAARCAGPHVAPPRHLQPRARARRLRPLSARHGAGDAVAGRFPRLAAGGAVFATPLRSAATCSTGSEAESLSHGALQHSNGRSCAAVASRTRDRRAAETSLLNRRRRTLKSAGWPETKSWSVL